MKFCDALKASQQDGALVRQKSWDKGKYVRWDLDMCAFVNNNGIPMISDFHHEWVIRPDVLWEVYEETFNIEQARDLLEQGRKVRRKSWEHPDHHVVMNNMGVMEEYPESERSNPVLTWEDVQASDWILYTEVSTDD